MNKLWGTEEGKVQACMCSIDSYRQKASVGFRTWHFIKSKHTTNRADGKVLRHEAVAFFIWDVWHPGVSGSPERGYSKRKQQLYHIILFQCSVYKEKILYIQCYLTYIFLGFTASNSHTDYLNKYTENNEKDTLINHLMCATVILNHDLLKKREMGPNCKFIEGCVPQITQGYRKSMFPYRAPFFHPIVRIVMCFMLRLTYNVL